MNYIKLFIVIILYFDLTIGEVLIHKYRMHNKPNSIIRKLYTDSHVKHHLDIRMMKLKQTLIFQSIKQIIIKKKLHI